MIYTFKDYYRNEVKLSFEKEPFSTSPKHVWIICRYQDRWLLTKHRTRGIEFPGGKVEAGERVEDAAYREVLEETGASLASLTYVAQYYVSGKAGDIIKNVYFGEVDRLLSQEHYYETEGPILLDALPDNLRESKEFSFMMKDEVVVRTVAYIKKNLLTTK